MAKRRSKKSHHFSQIPQARIPRSSFNRSHGYKTASDAGYLVPIYLDEVLPGDTHNVRASLFGRLATPLKPIMHDIFMETFFFFVPNRLIWDNWEKFNGEQTNPGDSTDYTVPQRNMSQVSAGSLADYFGLPIGDYSNPGPGILVSDLPFRCYNLIWNEWFRDQNLQNSAVHNTADAATSFNDYPIRRRGKRHDYFTSCLPWPQKGDPVTVPLGDYAQIYGVGNNGSTKLEVWGFDNGAPDYTKSHVFDSAGADATYKAASPTVAGNLFADLSSATGFTINQLRESFQIQKLLERDARGGTRYTEIIRSHFGVISPDARLQRPEFLGGGSSMVNINPVAQTSGTSVSETPTPQGNLSAFGTVSAHNHGFTKSFTEHGWIVGLVNFRADLVYQQGVDRMWNRQSRFDFYWPALAQIGEQAVLNQEIYASGDRTQNENVFGYQERYAEYRYKPSRITNALSSSSPSPLDVWHLAQEFDSLPVLGDTFIQENPPIKRTSAVPSEPDFLLDCYFRVRSVRPMPLYGVPGMIDHF